MNTEQKITHLESALEKLKQQFSDNAVYSDEKLRQLQHDAEGSYNKTETYFALGARDLASTLQRKLSEGFTYIDHQASVLQYSNGNIHIELRKPEDVIQTELSEVCALIKDTYAADVANAEQRLIPEIAALQLEIKQAQAALKAETKAQSDLEKEIAKVKQEFGVVTQEAINNV